MRRTSKFDGWIDGTPRIVSSLATCAMMHRLSYPCLNAILMYHCILALDAPTELLVVTIARDETRNGWVSGCQRVEVLLGNAGDGCASKKSCVGHGRITDGHWRSSIIRRPKATPELAQIGRSSLLSLAPELLAVDGR